MPVENGNKEPPGQIFLSHSKHDKKIRNFFMASFSQVDGIIPQTMEFGETLPPPWTHIKDEMEKSKAVFILLGEGVVESGIHTQNWISFEVGLACALKKDVWVFEQRNVDVHFPIPYLNYYFHYDPENDESLMKIREIIRLYAEAPEDKPVTTNSLVFVCPSESCKVEFRLPLIEDKVVLPSRISCPACRRKINFDLDRIKFVLSL